MTSLILQCGRFLTYFSFDDLRRSIVRLSNTGFSFSPTYSTDSKTWQVYYNRKAMLSTLGHLITPLFWGRYLYIIYFGIVNV